MKQSFTLCTKELSLGSDIVHKYTFKTVNTRGKCALLAISNHQIAYDFANTRVESANFNKKDCFECHSPHEIAM